jgi:hypothetical protein
MIPFTKNHTDHSNEQGAQFEFFCDKCGSGRMSEFVPNKIGIAAGLFSAAGNLFGGRMAQIASAGSQVKDMFRGKARDAAFARAVEAAKLFFKQCTRCGRWVCPQVCWNEARNLCEVCAPDPGEEAAAVQAQAAREQVTAKARSVDQAAGVNLTAQQLASCPHCGARVQGGKFCPSCGKPLASKLACAKCGVEFSGKFCPECGTPANT